MSAKQIILTLIVFFCIDSVAMSQIKKQYKDEVHKSTTIVIKEDGVNDFDILNNQFNLDDYQLNEQIRITTDQSPVPISSESKKVSGAQSPDVPAPDLTNATASVTPEYQRPKTRMKRWSVRKKKESTTAETTAVEEVEEKIVTDNSPTTLTRSSSRSKNMGNAKKSSSGKYRKKSKKVKKKKRVRKLKNRKRKTRRSKKGACYKF